MIRTLMLMLMLMPMPTRMPTRMLTQMLTQMPTPTRMVMEISIRIFQAKIFQIIHLHT